MHYTLKQLRYLEAAARLNSITSAAHELNISPSSVAAAIDSIEYELAQILFARHPSKGIIPTRYCVTFLENVRELLRSHIKFENSLPGISDKIEGSIKMGCFTPIAPIILPLILKVVSDIYPTLSVQIIEGDASQMASLMRKGEIDLALTYSVGELENFYFQSLFQAPPHIALSSDHPLANRRNLTLEDLIEEPLILLDLDRTRAYMLDLFNQRKLTPNILYSSQSSEMVRSLVAAGLGYAIFNVKPRNKQTYTVGDIIRIPLSTHHIEPEFGIIHHGKAQLSLVAKAILRACFQLKGENSFKDFVVKNH